MVEQKDKIIAIIRMFFPRSKIYLFGSYARGNQRRGSDIDIAIDNGEPLAIVPHQQVINMIECLNLVQKVDVVDFQSVSPKLQENILKEGILWNS